VQAHEGRSLLKAAAVRGAKNSVQAKNGRSAPPPHVVVKLGGACCPSSSAQHTQRCPYAKRAVRRAADDVNDDGASERHVRWSMAPL